jgi:hypothetical protein
MSQKFWRIPYVYSVVELLKIVLPEFGESIEFATAQRWGPFRGVLLTSLCYQEFANVFSMMMMRATAGQNHFPNILEYCGIFCGFPGFSLCCVANTFL